MRKSLVRILFAIFTLFKMTADGVLTNWVEFNSTNRAYPTALVQGADGNLCTSVYSRLT